MVQKVQPKHPVIDWSNPLTRGLLSAFSFAPGPIRDLVTGKELTMYTASQASATAPNSGSATTPTFKATEAGMGVDMGLRNSGADSVWLRNSTGIFDMNAGNATTTIVGLADWVAPSSFGKLWETGNNGNGNSSNAVNTSAGDTWFLRMTDTNVMVADFGPTTEHNVHGWSYRAGVGHYWLSGRFQSDESSLDKPFMSGATYNLGIGSDSSGTLPATWTFFAQWNRDLSKPEMATMTANPWQIFKSRTLFAHTEKYFPPAIEAQAPAGNTLTITLVDAAGTPLTGLTGLSWAWFDESTVNSASTPTATGTGATTDGSGVFSVDITGTTLTSGQIGMLALMDSTGYIYALYRITLD